MRGHLIVNVVRPLAPVRFFATVRHEPLIRICRLTRTFFFFGETLTRTLTLAPRFGCNVEGFALTTGVTAGTGSGPARGAGAAMGTPVAKERIASQEFASTPPSCQTAIPSRPYWVTSGSLAATPRESTHHASWSTVQDVFLPADVSPE